MTEGVPVSVLVRPTLPLAEMCNPPAIVFSRQHQFLLLLRCHWVPHNVGTQGLMSLCCCHDFSSPYLTPFEPPTLNLSCLSVVEITRSSSRHACLRHHKPSAIVVNKKEVTHSLYSWVPKDKGRLYVFLIPFDPQHLGMWRWQGNGDGQCSKSLTLSIKALFIPPNYLLLSKESLHEWRAGKNLS